MYHASACDAPVSQRACNRYHRRAYGCRKKPQPTDEARGGLNIVEQSLWHAVPQFMRKLNSAVVQLTGQDLPVNCSPLRFASWMGGDRDGNPNVTAQA